VAARHAVITGTSSPLAVRSGYEALARGGNAADAALTAALAQVALVAGSYVS
jgi:gamma-glutamyltranspeptidase